MHDDDDAAETWARETHARHEAGGLTWAEVRERFDALTEAAKSELRVLVDVGLDALENNLRPEIPPPCEQRFLWFVAELIDLGLADRVAEQRFYTSDAAWDCDCDECVAFVSRVEATIAGQGRDL